MTQWNIEQNMDIVPTIRSKAEKYINVNLIWYNCCSDLFRKSKRKRKVRRALMVVTALVVAAIVAAISAVSLVSFNKNKASMVTTTTAALSKLLQQS